VTIEGAQQGRDIGMAAAQPGPVPIHESLGVEKIRVHQTGEQHPHPKREPLALARRLAQVQDAAFVGGEQIGWRFRGQGFPQLLAGAVAVEPMSQAGLFAVPIGQSRMMAGDQIGQDAPLYAQPLAGKRRRWNGSPCPVCLQCGCPGRSRAEARSYGQSR